MTGLANKRMQLTTHKIAEGGPAARAGVIHSCVAADPRRSASKWPLDTPSAITYNVHMSELRFVWDPAKNLANQRKHGVSFEEAQTAFHDERATVYYDPEHSEDEDRFLLLGMSLLVRVLVVCHCYREGDLVVRIISARRADRREEEAYWS